MRQPDQLEEFQQRRLFASDVDNTQILSFERSPEGIGVEEGYRYGIQVIYGQPADNQYVARGGHRNRTPAEIALELVPFAKSPEVFTKIAILSELDYPAEDIVASLNSVTPSRRTIDASDLSPEEVAATSQLLIDLKLQKIMGQIGLAIPEGGYWPRPVPGFIDFIDSLSRSQEPIDTAVISAGHTEFINRVYDLWGIPYPDIYVTTETITELGLPKHFPPDELAKPAPLLMTVAEQLWLQKCGLPDTTPVNRDHVLYVGDDLIKDGGLAANAGVDFIHIDPRYPEESWQQVTRKLLLDCDIKLLVVHEK